MVDRLWPFIVKDELISNIYINDLNNINPKERLIAIFWYPFLNRKMGYKNTNDS